jgi:hypothetical protein
MECFRSQSRRSGRRVVAPSGAHERAAGAIFMCGNKRTMARRHSQGPGDALDDRGTFLKCLAYPLFLRDRAVGRFASCAAFGEVAPRALPCLSPSPPVEVRATPEPCGNRRARGERRFSAPRSRALFATRPALMGTSLARQKRVGKTVVGIARRIDEISKLAQGGESSRRIFAERSAQMPQNRGKVNR